MATQTLILLGVVSYMAIMIAIGYYASRGNQSLTDFIVAGRKMPLWLCSISIFATWFGSGTMMGAATAAYEGDTLLMIGEPFGSGLALFLSGLFFARLYRRSKRLTWPEFFEARFGKSASAIGSVADATSHIIWLGGVLFTFGVLLESLAGTPMAVGIFGGLLIIVVYTMIGGMWAVALTDFIQMLVFVIGMFVLLYFVLDDAGGWSVVAGQLPEHSFRMFPLEHTFANWIDHIHVWMALGVAAVASSSIIQRALSARTERTAQNSFYIAAFGYVTIGLVPLMLGFAATVTMPDLDDPNAVLTDLAIKHMHPVFVALFVGAILSAIMSTSDSILLGVSSIISTNLLPLVKKDPSEKLRLQVARYAIPVCGLIATYIAFNANRVVEVLIESAAVLLAAIIVPFILCFWWRKANRLGALAGMLGGLLAWMGASAAGSEFPPDLIGFLVSLVAMGIVVQLTQKIDPPRPLTDIDGDPVDLINRIGTLGFKK
ncbi:MAG: sodium:solute symporter family protein [Gammaproteobacteria bacterium]|nr:sodium:solute symporter family protein [Gammaproteobacteria bacterium]